MRPRGAVGALAASSLLTALLTVAGSGPAAGVSATLAFDCTALSGPGVFTAVIDTDAPAVLLPGQSASFTMTSTVTIPPQRADGIRLTGTQFDGTVTQSFTVDGAARTATLTIPRTPVDPTTGHPQQAVATGPGGSLLAGVAGTQVLLAAGSFDVALKAYDSLGTLKGSDTWTCTIQPQQATVIDVVQSGIATTTTVSVSPPVEYGGRAAVSVDVAVASGPAPDGSVVLTLDGATVTADVRSGHAETTLPPALTIGTRTVTAAFTPSDANLAPSQGSADLEVVRDRTTTNAAAAYHAAADRLVGSARVTARHGTAVTGQVKLLLKLDGVRIRSARVTVDGRGRARKVFAHVSRAGRYTVVARYLGSPTLRRSAGRAHLTL